MTQFKHPNFLNLPPELSDPKSCGAVILPLPLDLTASWKRGTAEGPAAIIEASHHIEFYDEETVLYPAAAIGGIYTHPFPELPTDPESAVEVVDNLSAGIAGKERILIALGGEHAVTFPLVRAHQRIWHELCVLQIDAHADLRESYYGSPYNHACPMRRISELGIHVTAVGIRSIDESELEFVNGPLNTTFFAHEWAGRLAGAIPEIVDSLPSEFVYLTIDLDGLDPSVIPAVGTPIPGGLGWHETLALLRAVIAKKTIIGADVVELSPTQGLHCADSAAARIVFKIIAYFAEQLKREK